MKTNYFWADFMPDISKTDLTRDPGDVNTAKGYYYSLLYRKDTIDRNSWIQNITDLQNTLNHVSTKVFGYRYSPFYADASKSNIVLSVSYVIAGSAAEKAGLQRGDIIMQINGTQLTVDNYSTFTSNLDGATFGLADLTNGAFVLNGKKITATKADVTENTVAMSKIITKGTKKIGYLLYTGYVATYDANLRSAFANFKSAGVNELVVDLRLNGGGSVNSSVILSSLIVKNLSTSNLIFKYEMNKTQTDANTKQYGTNYFNAYFSGEANNLNLNRVYFLVSGGSASASELTINNLKPFMDVYLIGSQTYGKNEFSNTFTDNRWAWGMQPLLGRTVNSKGESAYGVTTTNGKWVYQGGIQPDYAVTDNSIPFKAFGDESETLFAKALTQITGLEMTQNARQAATAKADLLFENKGIHLSDEPSRNRYDMTTDKFLPKK